MEACEFGPDHVHLFVSRCKKNYSVPYLVQRFKGASVAQDQAGAVGEGEGEVVGRLVLERRILLQVGGIYYSGGRPVLRPAQSEEALDAIRL